MIVSRESASDKLVFFEARKKTTTKVARVEGPFSVVTQHGTVECEDGYVAVDEKGWPYPISTDVFEASYERV